MPYRQYIIATRDGMPELTSAGQLLSFSYSGHHFKDLPENECIFCCGLKDSFMNEDKITDTFSFFKVNFLLGFIGLLFRRVFLGAAMAFLLFYILTNRDMGVFYLHSLSALFSVKRNLISVMFICALITLILIGLSILLLVLVKSNRIAGPFYRLEKIFKNLGEGDFSQSAGFRKTDAIALVSDEVEKSIENLNSYFKGISEELHELKKEAQRLYTDDIGCPADVLLEKINDIKGKLDRIKTS